MASSLLDITWTGMESPYRDLIKHSGVYGLGQILTRLASVILLPLYTRWLTPADYGCIAILDLTATVLGILVGGGMVAAVSRYHFDSAQPPEQNEVWWTGLTVVALLASLLVAPTLVMRDSLARVTLGAQESGGGYFYTLVLPTLWFTTVSQIPDQYLRVRKWSWLSVSISLGGLLLNVALNVYFLTIARLGIAGILWGNLLTGAATTAIRCAVLAWVCRPYAFNQSVAVELCRFGSPMIATGLLATAMHQADRYMLRLFVSLDQVGVYSLAYTVSQGLNALCLTPFAAIWSVVMYDIAKQPEAKIIYARVFEYFVYALLLMLLGVSLFVKPLLAMFVSPEYAEAARLIPIVCLAFVFFSIHEHFKVPALLAKRTVSLVSAYGGAAAANIALNLMLIPAFGMAGAAWASVATYGVFSGIGLLRYQRIDRFEYPLRRCGVVLMAMIVSYLGCRYVETLRLQTVWSLAAPGLVWAAWAFVLLHPCAKKQFRFGDLLAAS